MNPEKEDYLTDVVVLGTKIVDRIYKKEIDITTDDGKLSMIFSLSFLLVGVVSDEKIRAKVNSIVLELELENYNN